MSNEEFIRSYEDASSTAESVGWLVSSVDSGNFLVSYVFTDREGVFKRLVFEVLGKEQIARRITRSMGEYYAGLIDDRFRNSLKVTAERELVTLRVMNFASRSADGPRGSCPGTEADRCEKKSTDGLHAV